MGFNTRSAMARLSSLRKIGSHPTWSDVDYLQNLVEIYNSRETDPAKEANAEFASSMYLDKFINSAPPRSMETEAL